jgi:hypothetical protein
MEQAGTSLAKRWRSITATPQNGAKLGERSLVSFFILLTYFFSILILNRRKQLRDVNHLKLCSNAFKINSGKKSFQI